MTIKSIIFIFYRKKLFVSFFISLSIHFLVILYCIFFDWGEVASNRSVDSSIQLSLVSEKEKGSDAQAHVSQNSPIKSDNVSSKAKELSTELIDEHLDNSSTVSVDSLRLIEARPYVGGGLFTRHLRRSTTQQVLSSRDVDVERDQQNAYRLAVFSLFLSNADSVICVLRNNSIECENGYEMGVEKTQEWRYLYAQQLLPNQINVKRDYLVKSTPFK